MSRPWLALLPALLPELRRFELPRRAQALQRARDTALDVFELVGMAIGLVASTALTRLLVNEVDAGRLLSGLLNFAIALPLLLVLLGPLHVRRLRRGLREQLRREELSA